MDTAADISDKAEEIASTLSELSVSGPGPATKKKSKKKKPSSASLATNNQDAFSFHESRLRLIKMAHSAEKGRSLLASSTLPAGTLFFNEKPVVAVSHEGELCTECGSIINGKQGNAVIRDQSLSLESFCSEQCKLNCCSNPTKHRFLEVVNQNVANIAAQHNCDKDLLRMVFRLLLLCTQSSAQAAADVQGTSTTAYCVDDGPTIVATIQGINALEPHLEQQPAEWRAAVSAAVHAMLAVLLADSELCEVLTAHSAQHTGDNTSTSEYLNTYCVFLACIVNVNAYGIVNYSAAKAYSVGFGLFPTVGLCVNHSCCPNSYYTYNTATGCMEYRTIRTVAANEELAVSYADNFQDTATRREYLLSERFFLCRCERCSGLDLVYHTVTAITAASKQSGAECGVTKKKGAKSDEEAQKQRLSPFYKSSSTLAAEDDDWMSEPTTGATSAASATNKSTKGKAKPACDTPGVKKAAKSGTTTTAARESAGGEQQVLTAEIRNSMVADAMLAGQCCENCGIAGVIVSVAPKASIAAVSTTIGSTGEGTSAVQSVETCSAACVVCANTMDYQQCADSMERCRTQWSTCSNTVQYTTAGAASAALLEKFLQEADPEYAQYSVCALNTRCIDFRDAYQNGATSNTGAVSAQAQALERRRKLKCPVQLHAHHVWLVEAYKMLHEHLLVQYHHAESTGAGASVSTPLLARAVYALRRVIRARRSLLLPLRHPEVGMLQYELAGLLETALRHCAKSSNTAKELRQECVELLGEVLEARSHAFGADHELTVSVRGMLNRLK